MSKLHQSSMEITSRKHIETMSNFCPSKLGQKKYIEMMPIFRPLKLSQKKYVEMMTNFHPWKLHWRSTSEWCRFLAHRNYIGKVRRNDLETWYFLLTHQRNIKMESTSIRRGTSVGTFPTTSKILFIHPANEKMLSQGCHYVGRLVVSTISALWK